MQNAPQITDRPALLRQRARAARNPALFLHEAARDEVQDRLGMVNKSFTAPAIITPFPQVWADLIPNAKIIPDDDTLALTQGDHDLVIHTMALHWANDPVGQLIQCCRALKPDGLMLTTALGGQTLNELRSALAQAETEITGGLSPRVAPMAEIRDLGALLQRAGFGLPVADTMPLTVSYETPWHLMRDLRAMGETNALSGRLKRPTGRAVFARAAEIYGEHFTDASGRITATFELITLTGWAPDASQPKPLRPGSASARLADALGVAETPLKD